MQDVSTFYRLERLTLPFEPKPSASRRLASPVSGTPFAEQLTLSHHAESSLGDRMHKLVLVGSGLLDVEGASGGWLILPNHMILIPADRAFTVRLSAETTLRVAHLDPADAEWYHHGCWITAAPALAREMLLHALQWPAQDAGVEARRQFFRTLSHLCQDWFATPRILWLPVAESDELRAAVNFIRQDLERATLDGAAAAAGCSARTLQRRCKDEFGHSWRWFAREVKIMRAMELLARHEGRIGTVSRAAGFGSVAAFAASFADRVGMPPSEFVRRTAAAGRSAPSETAAQAARGRDRA